MGCVGHKLTYNKNDMMNIKITPFTKDLKEYNKWIRLDPRGNKHGVDAQFSVDGEKLAFPIRKEKGEEDCFTVFPTPDAKILEKLINNRTRTELWKDLPTELNYKSLL